jgi:type II secretion system protein F domain protein
MTTEMIKVGMETNLAAMMKKLLNLMELDINDQLEKLMKVLPELTYLVVGAVLIFFVLVVLVPVMQVYMGTFAFSAFNV